MKEDRVKLGHALKLLPGTGTLGILSELVNREAQIVEFSEALLPGDFTATSLSMHQKLKC